MWYTSQACVCELSRERLSAAVLRDELVALAVQHVLSCYEMYPNSFLQACTASQIHITSWIGSGCWALSSHPMQVEASATAIAAKSRGHL